MTPAVDAVLGLPLVTRAHVVEEGEHDPGFWSYFAPLALGPNPGRAVDDDMKRAVINELDPSRHVSATGRWPLLRRNVRAAISRIAGHFAAHGDLDGLAAALGQEGSGVPGMITTLDTEAPSGQMTIAPVEPIPMQPQATIQTVQPVQAAPAQPASSPSVWATIAAAVGQAGQAAAKIYTTQVTARTQQSVASIQQRTAAALAAARAKTSSLLGGAGSYVMYALLGLLGLGGLILLMKALKRK